MRPQLLFLGLLVVLGVGACAHSADGPSPAHPAEGVAGDAAVSLCSDSADAFRSIVSEFQSRQQNVAISVGVQQGGRTVFREATGLADLENRVPADPAMAFGTASITKAFTGVALLRQAGDAADAGSPPWRREALGGGTGRADLRPPLR
jgi:CubicO group peptidase (beta-lactamase class C family)